MIPLPHPALWLALLAGVVALADLAVPALMARHRRLRRERQAGWLAWLDRIGHQPQAAERAEQ